MTSLPVSCIVFDLDGTLIDSAGGIAAAVNDLRSSYSLDPLDEGLIVEFVGADTVTLLQRTLFGVVDDVRCRPGEMLPRSVGRMEEAYRRFLRAYSETATTAVLHEGVATALAYWRDQGVALVALTNKPHEITERILAHLGIRHYFDAIARRDLVDDRGRELIARGESQVFRFVASQTGAILEETWLVGDGASDIELAREAGVRCVSVLSGYTTPEELYAAGCDPDFVVPNLVAADQLLRSKTTVAI